MNETNMLYHIDPNHEILLHGGRWSEEAKERVRQARKAGRSVQEMFASFYKTSAKPASGVAKAVHKGDLKNGRSLSEIRKAYRNAAVRDDLQGKNKSAMKNFNQVEKYSKKIAKNVKTVKRAYKLKKATDRNLKGTDKTPKRDKAKEAADKAYELGNGQAEKLYDNAQKEKNPKKRKAMEAEAKRIERKIENDYAKYKARSKRKSGAVQHSALVDVNNYQAILQNQNELKHYGVLGMKWGKRKGVKQKVASYVKNYGRNMYNTVRHPIYHNKAHNASKAHSFIGNALGVSASFSVATPYGTLPVGVSAKIPSHTALVYKNDMVNKLVTSKRKMDPNKRKSIKYRLSKEYRLGEAKRVENAIRNTPYRRQGISYTG